MRGARPAVALLLTAAALPGQAAGPGETVLTALAASPAPAPLDLRLPRAVLRPALDQASPHRPRDPALRLEPRKSLIERGVAGSREALIACQKGAYPGATVTASGVLTAGGESQPDHCYRF